MWRPRNAEKPRRRIGPIGTSTRLAVATALLYLALFDGKAWGLSWYDAGLALAFLAIMLALGSALRHYNTNAVRFTGSAAIALNCAVIVALFANRYTAGAAELFYGVTLLLAA